MRVSSFIVQKVTKLILYNFFEQNRLDKGSLYEDRFEFRSSRPHIVRLVRETQRDRISLYEQGYHKN